MFNQKGNLLIVGIFIGLLIGGGLYAAYTLGTKNQVGNTPQPTLSSQPSFSSTTSAQPAALESQPVAKASPAVSPNPTANWKTYSNQKYSYSIKYPTYLGVDEHNDYYHNVNFTIAATNPNSLPLPTFYISVISDKFTAKDPAGYNFLTSDWIDTLYNMKVGEIKPLSSESNFKKLSNINLLGQSAVVIEVVNPSDPVKQQRVYLKQKGYVYMLAVYYQNPEELVNFQDFLSTLKFF